MKERLLSSKARSLKLTSQLLSAGGQRVNKGQSNTHDTRRFSHWSNTLETLQVIFWAPQHLVSVNCLSCRGKKAGALAHARSCRTPKPAWSPGCAAGSVEAVGAPVQHGELLGSCRPSVPAGLSDSHTSNQAQIQEKLACILVGIYSFRWNSVCLFSVNHCFPMKKTFCWRIPSKLYPWFTF